MPQKVIITAGASEIADTACFLASDAARHITAQEMAVDGNCEWEQ